MKLNSISGKRPLVLFPEILDFEQRLFVKFNLQFNCVLVGYHTVLKLPTGASLLHIADMGDNYALFGKEKWVVRRERDMYFKKFKTFGIKQLMDHCFRSKEYSGSGKNLQFILSYK